VKIQTFLMKLEAWAPAVLAETWDAPGLQVGNPEVDCTGILCCLDVTPEVCQEAIRLKANLIVSHHPLLFVPLKVLDLRTFPGRVVETCLMNGLTVFSLHTNADKAIGGLNDYAAQLLGLREVAVLPEQGSRPETGQAFKLVTFVPREYRETLLQALFRAGGGRIGAYEGCSFASPGTGTFFPGKAASPVVGEKGKLNEVTEDRIEVLFPPEALMAGIAALRAAHPYEEPAFDLYPLVSPQRVSGYVRAGRLRPPLPWEAFLGRIRESFGLKDFRVAGKAVDPVTRVALCTGSGAAFLPQAAAAAEVYITADLKYHEAREAISRGLTVIDAGHFAMERIFADLLWSRLTENGLQREVEVFKSAVEYDPFTFYHVGGDL
jgi:dinuclear metal center YbgI/SA1388 family protein